MVSITGKALATFMNQPVAARLVADSFFKSLQRPKQELGITGKDLVTFRSGSVAVRLDEDSFFKSLQRLEQVFGITGKNLDTVMSDSVAVRLKNLTCLATPISTSQDSSLATRADTCVTWRTTPAR